MNRQGNTLLTERNRPRLNITLDSSIKQKLNETADELDLSVSRLIEAISRDFLDRLDDDPTVGHQIRRKNRKATQEDEAEDDRDEQIDNILEEMKF